MSPPVAPPLPPDALPAATPLQSGAFAVDSLLGRGGFGLTYLCAEPALLRWVAVKELFPPGATRNGADVVAPRGVSPDEWDKAKRAFETEARRLATFSDPAVVRVYSAWQENNTAYMAMEALDGGSLAARLKANGPLSPARVAELGIALCRALDLLHRGNLLHRDLKPDNIFFNSDESPVLIDFGNARGLIAQQTQTTSLALTPGYAPPEAYATRAQMTPASDLYALGATLWECLSGFAPPDATDRVLGAPLPDVKGPLPLVVTIGHALELKPDARFADAKAFSEALERALDAIRNPAPPPPAPVVPVAPPAPTPLPWTTAPDKTNCPRCGRPNNILDNVCPGCGRRKREYVPGEHLRRREEIERSWTVGKWVFGIALVAILVVGGLARIGRAIPELHPNATTGDPYTDSPTNLRTQGTTLRRALQGTQWVQSVRPDFGHGQVSIVATPAWQGLRRDDRLQIAKEWADGWRQTRAPLPAPFQITDAKGNVLGGRTTGADEPWLR